MPTRRPTPIRLLIASALVLAAAPVAGAAIPPPGTGAAPAASAAPAEPPPIQVVREGDGVADVWRREGVDFPAYGPDGAPVAPTAQRQALQALAGAYDVQFVALRPLDDAGASGARPACGPQGECIGGRAVSGRVPVGNIAQYRLASAIGGAWLRDGGAAAAPSCDPDYRHALTFSADGRGWAVLLDYACGHYRLHRDGAEVAEGWAAEALGRAELDALLAPGATASGPSAAAGG